MDRKFNIRLWFAIAGFGIIALIWATSAWWLTDFMTRSLLERESEVSQEFFQSIVDVEGEALFEADNEHAGPRRALGEFAKHVASTPGVMRANIYSAARKIMWSTEPQVVGKVFNDNDELNDALLGKRITEINSIEHHKSEYVGFGSTGLFIEAYLPLWSKQEPRRIVGVVELYKFPTALNKTIEEGKRIIWLSGLAAALLAYITLYWIVQRGARLIESQQRQMQHLQSAALIGDLASAVAHSLRNPMATIRTSAELWRSETPGKNEVAADEIIQEVDRMNDYVRDLLDYASSDKAELRPIDPLVTLASVLQKRDGPLRRNHIETRIRDLRTTTVNVLADPILFEHALTSVITNAIEAMPESGLLDIQVSGGAGVNLVGVEITDTGPGIPPALINKVSESYFTTKSKGLGLGLALARGVFERWGGSFAIANAPDKGTRVSIQLKRA